MATTAQWVCGNCRTANPPARAACSSCGTVRVVDLGTRTQPTSSQPTPPPPLSVVPPRTGSQPLSSTAPPPAVGKAPPAQRGVTRYLCCAVQLDAGLARRAIREIVEEPRRAVATSPGVDLPVVLAYALAARRRQLIRQGVLAVLLVLIIIGFSKGPLWAVPLLYLIAWVVVAGELFYVNYLVIVPQLGRKTFDPRTAPMPRSRHLAARLNEVGAWDAGNVMVSQHFAPFLGYGQSVDSWSYTVVTDNAKADVDHAKPFTTHELYEHVSAAVRNLQLRGMWVQDRLFVNGRDLRTELDAATAAALLPDPLRAPAPHVTQQLLHRLRQEQSGRARPYLVLQVSGWEGEVVATHFLRFYLSPQRDTLFVESSVYVLAGVRAHYRSVDTLLDHPTFRQSVEIILSTFPRTFAMLIGSLPALFAAAGHALGFKDIRERREIKEQTFNYGAPVSIRQAASDHLYYRYFQKVDVDMYTKMVARRVLESLIEFLDSHDIDTSELRDQSTTYMNAFNIGGNANVSFAHSVLSFGQNAIGRVVHSTGTMGGGGGGGSAPAQSGRK